MELHDAARKLADGHFSMIHDAAKRNLIFARSADDTVHAIVAEAVDDPTGQWLVECLRAGAPGAADALEAQARAAADDTAAHTSEHDAAVAAVRAAAITGQRTDTPVASE